jgi:hypothetical protein
MNDDTWNQVKDFYTQKFGTSPELVDIAPVLDLLRLCASGSSNKTIAKFYGESEESLMEIFDAYFGFMGWEKDLSFSPLALYKELKSPDQSTFTDVVIQRYDVNTSLSRMFVKMYESSVMVEKLERLFDEKWI